MEQDVKSAARQVIARMSRIAHQEQDTDAGPVHYQSMLAQLALAQLALTYPHAELGRCVQDDTPLHFVAKEDGLYVCCSAEGAHGWKIS